MDLMGLERRIASDDILEIFTENLLSTAFPHAYIQYEPQRVNGKLPDFAFGWPDSETIVFLEVTRANYPGSERKKKQTKALSKFAKQYRQYESLILYLQNLANVENILGSLEILEDLAKGKILTPAAQQKAVVIATTGNFSSRSYGANINWNTLYENACTRISPRC